MCDGQLRLRGQLVNCHTGQGIMEFHGIMTTYKKLDLFDSRRYLFAQLMNKLKIISIVNVYVIYCYKYLLNFLEVALIKLLSYK